MKHPGPPSWMQLVLRSLLPVRDRDTVAGDLYEEFCHRRVIGQAYVRTSLWYFFQVVSFAPYRCRSAFIQPRTLASFCAFTGLCACWLGAMDIRLRHPNYLGQVGIAAGILLQALLTLGALHFRRSRFLRYVSMSGCLILFSLAGKALIATVRGAALEGYVLVIALALLYQASLTWGTLPRIAEVGRRR